MFKRIVYIILSHIFLYSCSNKDTYKTCSEDPRWEVCKNISISMPNDSCFFVHPFPSDNGLIFAIPQEWENIANCTFSEIKDSVSIRYTKLNSIFINTRSGNMNAIHASKNHEYKEDGIIKILNERGEVVLSDSLHYIKGRGNSSWTKEKKSYNIKLEHKSSPLGLKKSSKFNLVSTHGITNGLALQIAQEFGSSSALSHSLVNLYLNGEYRGLFLLTNKVEADKSSVDINDLDKKNKKRKKDKTAALKTIEKEDGSYKFVANLKSPEDISGGYIIEIMNFKNKYKDLSCGFISKEGNRVRFKAPEDATEEEVLYIKNLYHEMYTAIKATDGINPSTKQYYADIIDLESFAKYYLLEESLSNMDGGYGNLYFYKDLDSIDSKLHLGPIWDMEWSMGINDYPYFLYPRTVNVLAGSTDEKQKMFYYLYQHNDFRQVVDSLYQNLLYPMLDKIFVPSNISLSLDNDVLINYLRWPDKYQSATEEFSHLCDYMRPHIEFLKEIFTPSANEDYYTVKINAGFSKRNTMFFVRKGDAFKLPKFQWFSTDGNKKTHSEWYEGEQKMTDSIITINRNHFFVQKWTD